MPKNSIQKRYIDLKILNFLLNLKVQLAKFAVPHFVFSQFIRRLSQGDEQVEANDGDHNDSAPVLVLAFIPNSAKNKVEIVKGVPIDVTLSSFGNEVTSLREV